METTKLRLLSKQSDAEYARYIGGSIYSPSRRSRIPFSVGTWPKDTFFSHCGMVERARSGHAYRPYNDPSQMRTSTLHIQSRIGLKRLA